MCSSDLEKVIVKEEKIKIGDLAILSEYFQSIPYNEGTKEDYRLIHWQDILGIIKRSKEDE